MDLPVGSPGGKGSGPERICGGGGVSVRASGEALYD